MQTLVVPIEKPDDLNLVFGQSHFVRTVEDLCEAVATSAPNAKFGLAFCEASGKRLVRHAGTDPELERLAVRNMERIGAGHTFLLLLGNLFPIHVLRAIREVPEVCRIFCATANPVQVVLAETDQGRGVLGVIDGGAPLGVEGPEDARDRHDFLRKIGLKA